MVEILRVVEIVRSGCILKMKPIGHADVLEVWNEQNRESRMTPDLGLVGSGGVEVR